MPEGWGARGWGAKGLGCQGLGCLGARGWCQGAGVPGGDFLVDLTVLYDLLASVASIIWGPGNLFVPVWCPSLPSFIHVGLESGRAGCGQGAGRVWGGGRKGVERAQGGCGEGAGRLWDACLASKVSLVPRNLCPEAVR